MSSSCHHSTRRVLSKTCGISAPCSSPGRMRGKHTCWGGISLISRTLPGGTTISGDCSELTCSFIPHVHTDVWKHGDKRPAEKGLCVTRARTCRARTANVTTGPCVGFLVRSSCVNGARQPAAAEVRMLVLSSERQRVRTLRAVGKVACPRVCHLHTCLRGSCDPHG